MSVSARQERASEQLTFDEVQRQVSDLLKNREGKPGYREVPSSRRSTAEGVRRFALTRVKTVHREFSITDDNDNEEGVYQDTHTRTVLGIPIGESEVQTGVEAFSARNGWSSRLAMSSGSTIANYEWASKGDNYKTEVDHDDSASAQLVLQGALSTIQDLIEGNLRRVNG